MAHGTDTANTSATIQLGTTGIAVNLQTCVFINYHRAATVSIIVGREQVIGMGPDGVGCTAVGLALATIDDIHLIDIFVTVPIILFPVCHRFHGELDSLANHLASILVVALRVVCSIVRCVL